MITEGTRVRYIHMGTIEERTSGFYPPIGTCGTVVYGDDGDNTIQVKWDEGTDGDGIWWVETEYVEEVTE